MEDVKRFVSDIIKDMLDEIHGAEKYYEMAKSSTGLELKKMFLEMGHQELMHYDHLCEALKEKMRAHPTEITVENNIIAKTLFEDMKAWKEDVCSRIKKLSEELGVKF
jgi:rubrerythrin